MSISSEHLVLGLVLGTIVVVPSNLLASASAIATAATPRQLRPEVVPRNRMWWLLHLGPSQGLYVSKLSAQKTSLVSPQYLNLSSHRTARSFGHRDYCLASAAIRTLPNLTKTQVWKQFRVSPLPRRRVSLGNISSAASGWCSSHLSQLSSTWWSDRYEGKKDGVVEGAEATSVMYALKVPIPQLALSPHGAQAS
ncbi:hypothetical protein Tco_0316795 [Tanacetum coccineum]